MLFLLHGKDTFRSKRKLSEIIQGYEEQNKSGINLQYIDLSKEDFEFFRNRFFTRSMFNEKKLFILKQAFANNVFQMSFLASKERFLASPNLLVFYERGVVDKKTTLFKFLKAKAQQEEFEPLKKEYLASWAEKEFNGLGVKISASGMRLLISAVGSDLWRLHNEIQKLASWSSGMTKPISAEDVQKMVKTSTKKDIFKTVDAIAAKKKGEALIHLRNHLEKGDSPFYLLTMLAWQFSNLLAMKERVEKNKNTGTLGWHPYVMQKCLRLCKMFSFEELKNTYNEISNMDLKIKTGQIDPEFALEILIAKI